MSMYPPEKRSRSRSGSRTRQLFEARELPAAFDADDHAPAADEAVYTPNEAEPAPFPVYETQYEPNEPVDGQQPALEAGELPAADEAQPPVQPLPRTQRYAQAASVGAAPWQPEPAAPEDEAMAAMQAAIAQSHAVSMPEPAGPEDGAALNTAAPANAPGSLAANLAAYYRRPGLGDTPPFSLESHSAEEPAYAPPVRLGAFSAAPSGGWDGEEAGGDKPEAAAMGNVYRPREVTWGQTGRSEAIKTTGYQLSEDHEEPAKRRLRKHRARRVVTLLCVLAVLGGGAYFFREPLVQWIGTLTGQPAGTAAPLAALSTPAPAARGYDAATAVKISSNTSKAISEICGTLDVEPYLVTETSVMARNARADGSYDFYLFGASDGKLLAYYEGLGPDGVAPLPQGGFYVNEPPYLITDSAAAMIRTKDVEQLLGRATVLHPLMNGYAIISDQAGTTFNYIDTQGQLLSRLWFAKAYAMTGQRSVAYVDTGNLADTGGRYALYVVSADGSAPEKWMDAGDMSGIVASACGMAYLSSGELYSLEDTSQPLLTTADVSVYLDCDAMVVRDPESGKYGLYVHGERHYDFLYDSIRPVACDIQWEAQSFQGAGGSATLYRVSGAEYPQPLSHYFSLQRDGGEELVALSTSSVCPVLAD